MKNGETKDIKFFSMFSGIAGFEKGFEAASDRFKCVGFSEIDKYASELLADKFPGVTNYGDCTLITGDELPDFDVLVGGFSCQPYSIAGKRKGLDDLRGQVVYDIFRIAEKKKPQLILLENVKGFLSAKNKDGSYIMDFVFEKLCEIGYVIDFTILNSKNFGLAQNRERIFIWAIREDLISEGNII